MNFELDSYTEALKDFPSTKTFLETKKGKAKYFKMDVFKRKMSYFYTNEPFNPIEIPLHNVIKVLSMNKKGEIPEKLEEFVEQKTHKTVDFENVVGQDNINRFDKPKNKKSRKQKRNKRFKAKKQKEQ